MSRAGICGGIATTVLLCRHASLERVHREEKQMAFRPNYRFERSERDRLKKAKAEEKLRRQQERTAQRREPDPPEVEDDKPPTA